MESFGDRLKKIRLLKKITQAELGKKIGMSAQKISNLERGYTTGITTEDIEDLAQELNTTAEYLVSGDNSHNRLSNDSFMFNKINSLSVDNQKKVEEYVDLLSKLEKLSNNENIIDFEKHA